MLLLGLGEDFVSMVAQTLVMVIIQGLNPRVRMSRQKPVNNDRSNWQSMDPFIVYSKTPKGVKAVKAWFSGLSSPAKRVLALVDSKLSAGEIMQGESLDEAEMDKVLTQLESDGLIRVLMRKHEDELHVHAATPPMVVEEIVETSDGMEVETLDFSAFTAEAEQKSKSEQHEAERKAQEAVERASKEETEKRLREAEELRLKAENAEKARMVAEEKAWQERVARQEAEAKAKEGAKRIAQAEAERREREEAERKAKEAAERKARDEADARARVELEQKVREEAERRELEAAELRARAEAAEKARQEAEEHARREMERISREAEEMRQKVEAEAKARVEAEAREKMQRREREEAEKKAREEAESIAKAEAEQKAREEAERRDREAAELLARAEAAEKARLEAEEHARREMERITREAEEVRQKAEAEAKARAEAEARLEAERIAREEAEVRAQAEAEEKKRLEAERKLQEASAREAKQEEERKAREEAERQESERKAKEEKERLEKQEAAALAQREAERLSKEEAKRKVLERKAQEEEKARAKAEEKARLEAEKKAQKVAEKAAREEAKRIEGHEAEEQARARALEKVEARAGSSATEPGKFKAIALKVGLIYVPVVIAVLVGLLHVVSINALVSPIEKLATESLGEPVKVQEVHVALIPQPSLVLNNVSVGGNQPVKLSSVRVLPVVSTFFAQVKQLKSVKIDQISLAPADFYHASQWVSTAAKSLRLRLGDVRINKLTLSIPGVPLPVFSAKVNSSSTGELSDVELVTVDQSLSLRIKPLQDASEIELAASNWKFPFAEGLQLSELTAKGLADASKVDFILVEGRLMGGSVKGQAGLDWSSGLAAKSNFKVSGLGLSGALKAFGSQADVTGDLDASMTFVGKAADAANLVSSGEITANFNVTGGKIGGIDIGHAVLTGSGSLSGGGTNFDKLSGSVVVKGGHVQFKQLLLESNQLRARGMVDVMPDQRISGKISAELSVGSRKSQGSFGLAGMVGDLKRQ